MDIIPIFQLGVMNAWLLCIPFFLPAFIIGVMRKDIAKRMSDMTGYNAAEKFFTITASLAPYPFPIKGSLRWDGNRTIIEGSIPLFPILFFAAWLIGWTSGGVIVGLQSGISFDNVCSTLLGLAFVAGMFGFSIPLEMRRAREVLGEYEYYVEDRT